jgi:hypothetical protein
VLLAAALTYPFLAHIVKAVDANVTLHSLPLLCTLMRQCVVQGRRPMNCAELTDNSDIIGILNYPEGCKEARRLAFTARRMPCHRLVLPLDPPSIEHNSSVVTQFFSGAGCCYRLEGQICCLRRP